jgi:hypothetical protein
VAKSCCKVDYSLAGLMAQPQDKEVEISKHVTLIHLALEHLVHLVLDYFSNGV